MIDYCLTNDWIIEWLNTETSKEKNIPMLVDIFYKQGTK